jgi:3-oxoacyl-[acyl-carrier protein] reductase
MRLGPRGVRINALALGAIDHDTAESANPSSDEMQLLSHVPSKAAGRLDDVANAVLFLADPQNTYMTGHILPVDGGWIAGFARDF